MVSAHLKSTGLEGNTGPANHNPDLSSSRMGDVVNLRTIRKRAARQQAAERAAANRVLHGMPKSERTLLKANKKKAERALDEHRIDTGEGR
jgi:hypothetical protein